MNTDSITNAQPLLASTSMWVKQMRSSHASTVNEAVGRAMEVMVGFTGETHNENDSVLVLSLGYIPKYKFFIFLFFSICNSLCATCKDYQDSIKIIRAYTKLHANYEQVQ